MTPDRGYLGREMQAGWAGGLASGCLGHPGVSPEEGPNPAPPPRPGLLLLALGWMGRDWYQELRDVFTSQSGQRSGRN